MKSQFRYLAKKSECSGNLYLEVVLYAEGVQDRVATAMVTGDGMSVIEAQWEQIPIGYLSHFIGLLTELDALVHQLSTNHDMWSDKISTAEVIL
jgi:hypothetical protein